MKRCDNVPTAFKYLADNYGNRRLWTILLLGTGEFKLDHPCYVFRSNKNIGQQMFGIAKTILEYADIYGKNKAPLTAADGTEVTGRKLAAEARHNKL